MPASRSRTENWKSYLEKIRERNGSLEISVDRQPTDDGADLVWRVRVLDFTDDEIFVDPPAALGRNMPLDEGINLIGAMSIGQNRWMFHTSTVGHRASPRGETALVLQMPTNVERCSRRHSHRITTANLNLPRVQCWPLNDPSSVVAAETANRLHVQGKAQLPDPAADPSDTTSILLPDVGPMFEGRLVNLSGGGLGLLVNRTDTSSVIQRPYVWLRVDLRPQIAHPVAVTARVAHTHLDATQSLYAGLAFDFSHNPDHREFVVDRLEAYVRRLQAEQRQHRNAG